MRNRVNALETVEEQHTAKGDDFILCPVCRAGIRSRVLHEGEELHCTRCSALVKKHSHISSLQPSIAFAFSGLILVILANTNPIMTFEVAGNTQSNLIITGILKLDEQGYWPIGMLVFFSAIAAPILYFSSIIYVTMGCCTGRKWPFLDQVANGAEKIAAWNLMPVFVIACLAAVVKLDMLGSVNWKQGFLWIILLSLCSIALSHFFDKDLVEQRLRSLR